MSTETSTSPFAEYVGKQERKQDTLLEHRIADLAATLDLDLAALAPAGILPPLGHWLYFTPWALQSQLGTDGHPKRGGFMPPVELPRRMFAGARLTFHRDLQVGEEAERIATIRSIQHKSGASGALVFVTVHHEIRTAHGPAVEEEQDIVYREDAPPPKADATPETPPQPDPTPAGAHVRKVVPAPTLLFRYSALTSNTHRIHYDRSYAMNEEHYPGLVVHGPLQATLLIDMLREYFPGKRVKAFSFQARRPIFDTEPFTCVAEPMTEGATLSTRNSAGQVSLKASATFG